MSLTQIAWIFFIVGNVYVANDKSETGLLWLVFGMVAFTIDIFIK